MKRHTRATSVATAATFPAHPESSQTCAARAATARTVVASSTPGAGHRRATGAVVAVRTATSGEIAAAARAGSSAAATVVTRPAAAPRRDGAGRHVERRAEELDGEHQLRGLGHRVEQEAREHQAEHDPDARADGAEQRRLSQHHGEHVPPRRTDAAEQSDLLPPRRHAGGDGARHDEDRGEERQPRDAREQRAIRAQDALDLLAATRRSEHVDARRQHGPHGGLDPVDVDPGRERDVDLIDLALAAEHGLRAEHVHQQEVAAERAPDAARWQDAAYGEGADADWSAQLEGGADVGVQPARRRRR